jgi:hypothetical protein
MTQVIETAPAECGGFQVAGTTLISIDNAASPPLEWTYQSLQLPGTDACTNWFVDMAHTDGHDSNEVYIVGTAGTTVTDGSCTSCVNSSVVLARANISDLQAPAWAGAAEFWCEESGESAAGELSTTGSDSSGWWFSGRPPPLSAGKWAADCPATQLRPLFTNKDCGLADCAVSEMSLVFDFYLGRWVSVIVKGLSTSVQMWFSESDDVTSPWTSQHVYTVPQTLSGAGLVSYAGKVHPELRLLRDEIVFSFATNSWGNVSVLVEPGMASIYTPHLVSVQVAYASSLTVILIGALLSFCVLAAAVAAIVFVVHLRRRWPHGKPSTSYTSVQ